MWSTSLDDYSGTARGISSVAQYCEIQRLSGCRRRSQNADLEIDQIKLELAADLGCFEVVFLCDRYCDTPPATGKCSDGSVGRSLILEVSLSRP